MPSDKRPYWYEPAEVWEWMNHASEDEASWSQADFEEVFALDEETTDTAFTGGDNVQ
ncbi:unnamed protein product [marine sediment metagenome]|uniref:Uncharacterized protein n=1 Tax=marine sediment metagenome TaxID=412755 RepID=X1MZ02_9ZZZZ